MAYGEAASTQAPTPQSLLADTSLIVERLSGLRNHLIDVSNKLHGSNPRGVDEAAKGQIDPPPTVRRNLDKAMNLLGMIESEIQHIDARI